jgi:hypothetical protein
MLALTHTPHASSTVPDAGSGHEGSVGPQPVKAIHVTPITSIESHFISQILIPRPLARNAGPASRLPGDARLLRYHVP